MSETRRMTSIAARINRSFMLRLIFVLLFVDILLLALVTGTWCYLQEKSVFGQYWQPNIERSITVSHTSPWYMLPTTIEYSFSPPPAVTYLFSPQTVDGGTFFGIAALLFAILLVIETLVMFSEFASGRRRAERLLSPLRRMAETAMSLDKTFDTRKYHDLEEAISQVNIGLENARIETGDRDLKGMEDAVNGLLRRTQESYRQQSRFVSDASHELRTPISVIRGYADMLDRWGKNDEKVRDEAISAIQKEADNMQRLVEQLLFLARGDSGRQVLEMLTFDLTDMLREICEEMFLINPDREFLLQNTNSVYAQGDMGMLKQCVRILIDNAVRYSPAGERVTLRAFVSAKGEPCITVQDNGIGMRPEDVPHIFESFYRSDRARKREGGTGLGLSIAKWIVDAHNAYFDVITRESVGTRITLCLPPLPKKKEVSP